MIYVHILQALWLLCVVSAAAGGWFSYKARQGWKSASDRLLAITPCEQGLHVWTGESIHLPNYAEAGKITVTHMFRVSCERCDQDFTFTSVESLTGPGVEQMRVDYLDREVQ